MRRLERSAVWARGSLALLAAASTWLGCAGSAHALTLTAPAQALRSADVTATLESGDPTGTVTLLVDGVAVRSAIVAIAGGQATFASVPLAQGTRTLTATLADSGGGVTSAAPVQVVVWDRPDTPALLSPSGGFTAGSVRLIARAGGSTSSMTAYVDGAPISTKACSPGGTVDFGVTWLEPEWHVIVVIASNPYGESRAMEQGFTRLYYPASTCIVVDKSDYRLYWIRDDQLAGVYPVAIGKRRTATPNAMWIVNRREYMPPRGVYGPRRLKLARLVRYRRGRWRYRATGYGIHGTNQPWVIGTMASHGCIRLTNDMILDLWPQVPLGTVV